jgi:hypothetical protein
MKFGKPDLTGLWQGSPSLANNPPKFEGAAQAGLGDYTSIECRVMRQATYRQLCRNRFARRVLMRGRFERHETVGLLWIAFS